MGELVAFTSFAILIGFRHGMDSDHIAAITDMVGAETERKRQLRMGIMYACGHGLIVLILGLSAILLGSHLPHIILESMELLVGTSLLILGLYILYSIIRSRNGYRYESRFEIVYRGIAKVLKIKAPNMSKFGIIGAFSIGILHGIGAETPTQVVLLSSSVGLDNLLLSTFQLLLFVVGLILSTTLVTFLASWGFLRAKFKRNVYLILGTATGLYSVILGISIIYGI